MGTMRIGRGSAPVASSVRWLIVAMVAWILMRLLRDVGPPTLGSWPITLFELLVLTVMPALTGFALIRLFLAVIQSASGSLNTYTLTSSPWAIVFWLSFAVAMVGYGSHVTASVLLNLLPDVVRNGEFAASLLFFNETLTLLLVGAGFFGATAVILVVGRGAAPPVFGPERPLLALGSIVTYGYAIVYVATQGSMFIPAVLAASVLAILGLWTMGPYETTQDPIGLLVIPGNLAATIILITWGLVIGGRPNWPW
ncbi:MAG: hypothetical protein GX604_10285 [Actinobacteria bacterium]|nr:hypothetical protein [Actinomycetota bacterium]